MLKSSVLFLIGVALSLVSYSQEDGNILRLNKGKVAFHSQAELEVIRARTEEFKGVLDISKNEFAISIPIKNFLGFNSPLQMEHFNENYLESDAFENATYAGKIKNEFDLRKDGRSVIMTEGILTIHGIKVERDIEVELVINRGIIGIKSEFKVPLKDHGIKIPNAVKGKIAEIIDVEFFALFE